MAGVGGSVFCSLPASITDVLQADAAKVPTATRLACTLGPSSRSKEVIKELLRAGMNIARFDLTGVADVAYHLETLQALREAMEETNTLCAVMLNPAGPDLRVLNRPEGAIQLQAGQTLRLTSDAAARASTTLLPINWPGDFSQGGLRVGSNIFVGQYLFTGAETTSAYLTVQQVEPDVLNCVVNNTCTLEGALLTVKLDATARNPLPCLGAQDEAQLKQWAAATAGGNGNGGAGGALEFLALPRTRSATDVEEGRALLARLGLGHVKVVAKIEDMEGLVAHDAIVRAADAVLFSRGSLGTCLEPEKVNIAQRMMLRNCNQQGKPVFVTRVVDTMTDAPRPTRAEATDVANLVLDGADGILLGSETFRGKYPASTVRTVAAICRSAEAVFDAYGFYRAMAESQENPFGTTLAAWDRAEALASGAVRAAHKMDAKLIVVFTVTGRTARLVAKYRPRQPILTVVCTDPNAARFSANGDRSSPTAKSGAPNGMKKVGSDTLLSLSHLSNWSHGQAAKACLVFRGALPVMVDAPPGTQQAGEVLDSVLDYAKAVGLVSPGDRVVVSQCPRDVKSDVMSEGGVVQLVTVDQNLV